MTTSNGRVSCPEASPRVAVLSSEDASASVARCPAACASCAIRQLCLQFRLPRSDLRRLDWLVYAHRKVGCGEDLCRAGDPFSAIYVIRSGFFKSERVLDDGRGQIMGFHMPGEMVGMEGIGPGRYSCSAIALRDSEVCVIPLLRLEETGRELHGVQHLFFQIMGREIARCHGAMPLLGRMHAEQRLAAFLLDLSRRIEGRRRAASVFELPMTRGEIGSFLGLALETVSRVLSRLRACDLITVEQRRIRILDMSGLRRIVAHHLEQNATGHQRRRLNS